MRLSKHVFAEVRAQFLRGAQIDLDAQRLGQLDLDGAQADQAGHLAGLELYEQIQVAVRSGGALRS